MQDDLTLVVTGAAGFIGANLVKALNQRGQTRILAVDDLSAGDKFLNLVDCEIVDYLDKDEFLARLADGALDDEIGAILHQGACSDTMERDGRMMMRNNFRYSVALLEHCQDNDIPFVYASSASVYGGGNVFREERAHESPLNVYAYSKFLFDQYVRRILADRTAPIVGLRYFNVYGPREKHKGRMASVALHFYEQYRSQRRVKLFEGSGGYANGDQRRDFVHVDDVVAANLWFLDRPEASGIFNIGTGEARSFNAMAAAVINAVDRRSGSSALTAEDYARMGSIEYIPMPEALAGKYQSFTEADLTALRGAGYSAPFTSVEEGAARYVERLMAQS
ncbi:MAG TPA: ADP-glyceromanno-heptose 6-epimerase [Casimicrobiaceae bacterium]|nr:ADP-glyceromanno-heptose 6-epimerase [Casimicrobiaceae bacterium]